MTIITELVALKKLLTIRLSANTIIFFFIIQIVVFQPVFSAEKGMNVALILDTSGSMKKNDPNQLRIQAAKLFVSLLSREDKVSLVGFSNNAYPITPLLSLNTKRNEKRLLKAIEKMNADGKYTNLHDAILSGYNLLRKQKNSKGKNHIILMSDGKMDLGNQETNLRLLEKTLDDLAPKLLNEKIKVHTIAFTRDSYIPLLKLTAEDTDGQFVLLENANEIHQVFENIFERTKFPDMLPLTEDSFIVDKSVKEVTIVASKFRPNSIIRLESPNGDEISISDSESHNSNISWFTARKFDLITIKNPTAGYWLIKYSEGGNKAYIVSDIQLDAKSTKLKADPGTPLHIQAFLKKKNKRIRNKVILNSTKFMIKITSPTGTTIENELKDDGSEIGSERKDGIFGISYVFDREGLYKVEIIAQGETFDRKKSLFINVKSTLFKTPFIVKQDIINEPDILDTINDANAMEQTKIEDSKNAALKDNENEHGEIKPSHEGNISSSEGHEMDSHDPHSETSKDHENLNNEHSVIDDSSGESHTNEVNNEEDSDSELKASGNFGVKDAVIAFTLFNVFLLLIGGGYYAWYRKKQKEHDKDKNSDSKTEEDSASTNIASSIDESESGLDLEAEDSLSTSISDIDLEEELSSILEGDDN